MPPSTVTTAPLTNDGRGVGQAHDQVGDLVGRAVPAERHVAAGERRLVLRGDRRNQGRVDRTGTDAIGRHPGAPVLDGQRACESQEPVLGHRVGPGATLRGERLGRSHVDHPAGPPSDQIADAAAHDQHGAREVHGERTVPLLEVAVRGERPAGTDAGAVDDDVDRAVGLPDPVHRSADGARVGDVDRGVLADVERQGAHARRLQPLDGGAADAAGSPGDDGNPAPVVCRHLRRHTVCETRDCLRLLQL